MVPELGGGVTRESPGKSPRPPALPMTLCDEPLILHLQSLSRPQATPHKMTMSDQSNGGVLLSVCGMAHHLLGTRNGLSLGLIGPSWMLPVSRRRRRQLLNHSHSRRSAHDLRQPRLHYQSHYPPT